MAGQPDLVNISGFNAGTELQTDFGLCAGKKEMTLTGKMNSMLTPMALP